jgi:hypothetical protein
VPDVLAVPALPLGHPVPLTVLMETRDSPLHRDLRDVLSLLFCTEWAALAGISNPSPICVR